MITCRVLGPVELSRDEVPAPPELLWRKHLAVFVYLAHSPQRSRTREHLVALLWGDKPESAARHSLSEALRVIRRCAGEDALITQGGQIRLSDDVLDLDTSQFEQRVACGHWADAAALVAGEFMEGFAVGDAWAFEEWLAAQRREWRQRGVEASVRAAQGALATGAADRALEWGRRALQLEPGSDHACRAVILSLALAGNRAAALECFQAFERYLDDELGLEPDDETRTLAGRIRRERSWLMPSASEHGAESRRAPLVGRETDLARVLAAWERCRSTRTPSLVIIDGDPGSGKSRLVEEVERRTRLDGARTATVRAVPADREQPWSTARALVRAIAGGDGSPNSIDERGAAEALAADPPALSTFLHSLKDAGPVVLAIDAAHNADAASIMAVAGTLRDLPGFPLLVLLAAGVYPDSSTLDELRSRVGRDVRGEVVRLGPLGPAALRDLCRWAMPTYDDLQLERLARRVSLDSAGVPLLAVELLHAVSIGMQLRDAPAWPEPTRTIDQTLPASLPEPLVAAVRVGFRKLSPHAQQVLSAAALLDERASSGALSRAAGLAPDEAMAALDELEWRRWLVGEQRGYTFVARLIRDIVRRDMISSAQRERILAHAGER